MDTVLEENAVPLWRRIVVTIATLSVFGIFYLAQDQVLAILNAPARGEVPWYIRSAWFWGSLLLPALVLAAVLFGPRRMLGALGLTANPVLGIAVGVAGTLPMLAGLIYFGEWQPGDTPVRDTIQGAVLPGFVEEVFFRGMLFGFLFRFAGWGFFPASLLGAILFGGAHLYQGNDAMEAFGIFALTGFGGLWFAWLYTMWSNNLWVPISFHTLMNLYWQLFAVSENALGGSLGNATRLAVIVLSIVLTLAVSRSREGPSPLHDRLWRFT